MSRSIQNIQAAIIASKNQQNALNGLNAVSQYSIYNLWSFVVATNMYVQEQLWDVYQSNLETQIAAAPAWTNEWVQAQSFLFQYDSTTPQILTLNSGFTPTYQTVDSTKQIISRCSVLTSGNRIVSVKVATQNPPQILTTPQLTSFQGYLDTISPAGVQYSTVSYSGDCLYINAQIYYNGQYTSTILNAVTNSITNYMAGIPFNAYVRISTLEEAILNTTGVNDVVLNNVAIRPATVPFVSATYLVQNNDEIYNKYPMYAGYCVPETTSGYTLTASLTFIPGS